MSGEFIGKALPKEYCLRVFRVHPGSNSYVPLSKALIDEHQKTWVAGRCPIGGNQGSQRFFAAVICGPSAEVLIDFHNKAVAVHRETTEAYEKATQQQADFLPAVADYTEDMYECDRVSVIRA